MGIYDEGVDYEQARSPERVWKYNWAISQAAGVTDELADFTSEAEAAMTLADAEIEKGIALMREKVARARAERDALASARDLWRGRAMDKSAENARLRATIERVCALVEPRPGEFRTVPVEDVREALEGGSNV